MAKTVTDSLRNRVADARVTNLNGIELLDSGGTAIARVTGITWNAASGGKVTVSGTPTMTSTTAAGTGTDAVNARLYDDAGASGDELQNLEVAQDQNFTAWASATSYSAGDKVTNVIDGDTFYFVADTAHTSSAEDEPGVGDAWRTKWTLQDAVISNVNIADGDEVNINSLLIVEPDTLQ